MVKHDRREVWKDSLRAMRTSLESSYEMSTAVEEQRQFLRAWDREDLEYAVFSDYRRNEGKRRIKDVMEVIDRALSRIDAVDTAAASKVYLETLKTVALFSKWAKVLETSSMWFSS
ncbi:MAG: hypothetical protein ACFFD6_04750 [Candidatus Thorarchaeota archaeon]